MQIFHTSPNEITKIDMFGQFGECLCFSNDVYQMSACETIVYSLEVEETDIVEANSFFYRDDCDKLESIIDEIMDLAECDKETAEELLSQNATHEDPEIDWRIQGFAGEAAKVLGYKAAEAQDEQGIVYIVPMLDRIQSLEIQG